MKTGIAIGMLVAGLVLFVWGMNAVDSFSSDISRFFTGSPTDKAVWLMMGGIVSVMAGMFGLLRHPVG